MKCTVIDCKNISLAKGLCNKHYQRRRSYGDVNKVNLRTRPKCSVAGCEKLNFNLTFCGMHHKRFKIHGDPLFVNPKCNRDGNSQIRNREREKLWKKDNWTYYKAYLAARKTRIKQATPSWANLDDISSFYMNCPKGFHVDHIIPVNGKHVSGLHVIQNLQYLTAQENLRKSNK